MKLKNLIRSYSFWTALSGAVVMLAGALGRAFSFEVEEKIITDIIMAVAGLLVVFGVVSLPKDKDKEIEIPPKEDESNPDYEDQQENDKKRSK